MKNFNYIILFGTFLLNSCLGIDSNSISDKTNFSPDVSIPIGTSIVQYDSANDLPIQWTPSLPISFDKEEVLYFSLLETFDKQKYIQHVTLHFNTINQYPADVLITLTYQTQGGQLIDLTESNPIHIPPAEINGNGKVIDYTIDVTDIELTQDNIVGLFSTEELVVTASVSDLFLTPEVIVNMPTYFIKTSIGARIQLLIENN